MNAADLATSGDMLATMSPFLWDGSAIDLRAFGSLVLDVFTAPPVTAATIQYCPINSGTDGDWIDLTKLSGPTGAQSAQAQARGRYTGMAMAWVRIKPNTGPNGVYYIGAGS